MLRTRPGLLGKCLRCPEPTLVPPFRGRVLDRGFDIVKSSGMILGIQLISDVAGTSVIDCCSRDIDVRQINLPYLFMARDLTIRGGYRYRNHDRAFTVSGLYTNEGYEIAIRESNGSHY